MPTDEPVVPSDLLHAVAERAGRIALVIGAGCSLEPPTSLELSSTYARDVHQQLVLDGVLNEGDCHDPDDLSAVASAVWTKRGAQRAVVERLPRSRFRNAQANAGYLVAAALLRESAVTAVLTLNFDLAMSNALVDLGANEVAVISGPDTFSDLGSAVVVYLHRNVNETNLEAWILRVEALEAEWQGHWEEVLAHRVVACPVVVFAGLGSPAGVLTKTVSWVRERIDPAHHHAFVVDPANATPFKEALNLSQEAHIQMGWCEFMQRVAERLSMELRLILEKECRDLCTANSWDDEAEFVSTPCEALYKLGLVSAGKVRARWLLDGQAYAPDDERRPLLADLLLGISLAARQADAVLNVRLDGVVEARRGGRLLGSFLPASGKGTLNWAAMEPLLRQSLQKFDCYAEPSAVLIAGMRGTLSQHVGPPHDVGRDDADFDVARGRGTPDFVTVDDLRENPSLIERLVS